MNNSISEIKNKEIAIIGIAVKLPQAENTTQFWNNLIEGKDCITTFPKERARDIEEYLTARGINHEEIKYMEGAYLDDIDKFDYPFFRITPKEASFMNPNQRIFLETVYKSIEDAGYGGKKIIGSKTGVFVGYIGDYDGAVYKQIIAETDDADSSISITGNLSSIISGRISYLLDLRGPSMLVDTACSSSLVAVHTAIKSLQCNECEMAIVGGVKTNLIPILNNEKVGIESSDGKTRTFDDSSDGTGMGEGVVAIILKPLNKAIRDRDNIYAVIKGSSVNQDGSSVGLTAPNVNAQSDVIIKAWKDAGIDPQNISYIEAHGTGTKIGDPIEVEGIQNAFKRFTNKKQFCAIGSLKSNIGHLYDTAGIASLVKVALSIKYRKIPPTINFNYPNRKINFEESPVYVNNILAEWIPNGSKLLAGISSFGFSGTNCHVIVEEAPVPLTRNEDNLTEPNILLLSAKSKDALENLIREYDSFLNYNEHVNIKDLCYTCNTGREHHNFRIAIFCSLIKDLKSTIKAIINDKLTTRQDSKLYYYNNENSKKDLSKNNHTSEGLQQDIANKINTLLNNYISENANKEKLIRDLGELYISGAEIDWHKLYYNQSRVIISLPTYQFDKNRCWVKCKNKSTPKLATDNLLNLLADLDIKQDQIDRIIKFIDIRNNSGNQTKSDNITLDGKINNDYTKTEIWISETWCKELGYNKINIFDNFYELGGDSILAAKIVNSINREKKWQLNITDVLKHQSISKLSSFIDERIYQLNSTDANLSVTPVPIKEYYVVTPAQQRMLISSRLKSETSIYNMPFSIEINGAIDENSVKNAFNILVRRHEAFRTSFHWVNGEPKQKIHNNIDFNIPTIELGYNDYLLYKTKFIRPFDLGKSPLFRVEIVKVNHELYYILLDMHHIISDGSSMGIIVNDLVSILHEKPLPELTIQYKDFAEWQHNTFNDEYQAKNKEYWSKVFSDQIPVLNLPTDFPRPNSKSLEGDVLFYKFNQSVTESIKLFAKNKEITLFGFLLSAFNILLHKYSGQSDIVIGTSVHGRPNYESDKIVGMFVNLLAMRNYPKKDISFYDFMNQVKENSNLAFLHQDFQFDHLIECLKISRDTSREPIFDVVFAMQNMRIPILEINGNQCKYFSENRMSKYDIIFHVFDSSNELSLSVDYCTKIFKKETIDSMYENFVKIIQIVLDNYMIKIKNIEIGSKTQMSEGVFDSKIDFNF